MSKLALVSQNTKSIALVGNPNSGKTFIFNKLTGQRVKVANYPGTTVEIGTGKFNQKFSIAEDLTLLDMPGLYDLETSSPEEEITSRYISGQDQSTPDLILFVLDAQRMKQGIYLLSQIQEMNLPVIVVVNKANLLEKSGTEVDYKSLEQELNCPVFVIKNNKTTGYQKLAEYIDTFIKKFIKTALVQKAEDCSTSPCTSCNSCPNTMRYQASDKIWKKVCKGRLSKDKSILLDRFLLHPVYGIASFIATMLLLFWLIFSLSGYPMDWIDQFFILLAEFLDNTLSESWVKRLLLDGVIAGVGGILIFLPQILLLFFMINILENSGYLARTVCLIDKHLKKLGLPGNAFIPMLSAHTCAIPAMLSTRIIASKADRWRTIFIIPFFSCSARIPVYVMFTSMIFSKSSVKAALAFLACYLAGILIALLTAFLTKKFSREQSSELISELPPYCIPSVSFAFLTALDQGKSFIKQAGSFILIFSVCIWLLTYFPGNNLDESYLAMIGKFINPLFEPLGFDWRIVVGILTSFVAREVIISTFSIIFSEQQTLAGGLHQRLSEVTLPNGEALFSIPTSIALLVFFIFALQCVPTMITAWKETHSRWFVTAQFFYALFLAYALAYFARSLAIFLI